MERDESKRKASSLCCLNLRPLLPYEKLLALVQAQILLFFCSSLSSKEKKPIGLHVLRVGIHTM